MSGLDKSLIGKTLRRYLKLRGFRKSSFSMATVGLEGSKAEVRFMKNELRKIFLKAGAVYLGTFGGKKWLKDRFMLPYMRDEFLDNGLMIETLETVTSWSNLMPLNDAVKRAMLEKIEMGVVLTHISHAYSEGASLYYTVMGKQDEKDPINQWNEIKKAASQTIKLHAGAASHHHGVGSIHAPFLEWDKKERQLIEKMKTQFDPTGIMNPGKLL